MNTLREQIKQYIPYNEQEAQDQKVMLEFIDSSKDVLTRENQVAHFSASAWIVNQDRTKVLMIYHNIYDSWAWTGGHADGEADLLGVAIREAMEETGLKTVTPIQADIFSLEILTVNGHVKRGNYVSSHLHMNVTYLLEADESEMITVKPDENSGVRWIPNKEAIAASSEPWMQKIYAKLIEQQGKVCHIK